MPIPGRVSTVRLQRFRSERDRYLGEWTRAHGGYDAASRRWPRGWLTVAFVLAVPLARRNVSANTVTAAGVAASALAVPLVAGGGRVSAVGAALVTTTAVADSVDGAVALLSGTASARGHRIDSTADRITESLWLLGMQQLGARASLCALAGATSVLLERQRDRADLPGIGVVTVAERPTRALLAGACFAAAGAVPNRAATFGTISSVLWLALSAVGTAQLRSAVRRHHLRRPRS